MDSELPQNLLNGLREMAEALQALKLRFTLIGGIAVGFRSRPRFTKDLDFLLEVPQLVLPGLLANLHERGFSFDTEQIIREWTRDHLTALNYHGVRIDWLKPILPLYKHVIDQSKTETLLGCPLPIASPECLILTKLLAFRGQDQIDIENLLAANQGQLDLDYIRREWQTVGVENDPRFQKFLALVSQFYKPPSEASAKPAP